MSDHGLPVLYTLFVWWFSTGAILFLDGLPPRTFRWSMAGATVVALLALVGLASSADDPSVAGAYTAFTCALLLWGWHETSFLLGYVTGPRGTPCAADCTGWPRFAGATGTVLYHELGILASVGLVVALSWGEANQVGTWTFLVLWAMRLSAKLNLFLGVPNLAESFLPDHLKHLRTFMMRKPMNLLFPVSITLATALVILLIEAAYASGPGAFEAAAFTLVATLLALAIVEHWFMVLPVPVEALWRWGFGSRASADGPDQAALGAVGTGPRTDNDQARTGPGACSVPLSKAA